MAGLQDSDVSNSGTSTYGPLQLMDVYEDDNMEGNWRRYCPGVLNAFQYILLEKSFLSDLKFIVRSVEFKAHKLVLTIGSPVFESYFYSENPFEGDMITVSDLDPVGFRNMLIYLYTGDLRIKSIIEALSTYMAADKYEIPELMDMCERFLAEHHDKPSIVGPVLESAEVLNMKLTKQKYLEFVQQNTRDVLKAEGFLSASLRVVRIILNLNESSAPEIDLLEFVAKWVRKKRQRYPRSLFLALAPQIRFKAIKPRELCKFMERYPDFLEEDDADQILRHLTQPHSSSLPEWCNSEPPRVNPSSEKTFAQKLWSVLKNPQLFD